MGESPQTAGDGIGRINYALNRLLLLAHKKGALRNMQGGGVMWRRRTVCVSNPWASAQLLGELSGSSSGI